MIAILFICPGEASLLSTQYLKKVTFPDRLTGTTVGADSDDDRIVSHDAFFQKHHAIYRSHGRFHRETRRCGSVYFGEVVLRVWYFEHALWQPKNFHHILSEKTNPLLHLSAEPHSLYSMSQSTTKIVSFHDNVWKYAHLQCRHPWSQIATQDISGYSPESKVYLSSTDTDRCVFTPITASASYMYRVTIYTITWKSTTRSTKTSTLTVTLLNKLK